MNITSIGNGYYAGTMKNLDLIVVRKQIRTTSVYTGLDYYVNNPRLEIIKKLSEIAFF